MTKDKLQAELLEKIKGGIKPSDLKKKKPIKPEKDLGYESGEDKPKIPPAPPLPETKQIKQLKKDVKYWSQTANTHLKNLQLAQARISLLEEQVNQSKNQVKEANHHRLLSNWEEQLAEKNKQIEIIAKENEQNLAKANKATELLNKQSESVRKAKELIQEQAQSIKELQAENKAKDKTISDLQNQVKTTAHANDTNNKPETKENPELIKTFTCSECNQARPQEQLSRVFGSFSFCLDCSKKARHQAQEQKTKPQLQDFTCHLCNKPKTETPVKMKLDSTLQEYLICLECKPRAKEFNEADLITDELWEKYPYSSASEILEKEFGIKSKKLW